MTGSVPRGGTHYRQFASAAESSRFRSSRTVAGQISLVSGVVGKAQTGLRDSPDGTRVRVTIPRIQRRITRWERRWFMAHGQSGPLIAPINVLVVHSKLDNRPCKKSGNRNG